MASSQWARIAGVHCVDDVLYRRLHEHECPRTGLTFLFRTRHTGTIPRQHGLRCRRPRHCRSHSCHYQRCSHAPVCPHPSFHPYPPGPRPRALTPAVGRTAVARHCTVPPPPLSQPLSQALSQPLSLFTPCPRDDGGRTALHWAAASGHTGLLSLLLSGAVAAHRRKLVALLGDSVLEGGLPPLERPEHILVMTVGAACVLGEGGVGLYGGTRMSALELGRRVFLPNVLAGLGCGVFVRHAACTGLATQ